jgi:BirA family biotin operon repressor/biotin-[acetyl-CoA-carboxylase] ligase
MGRDSFMKEVLDLEEIASRLDTLTLGKRLIYYEKVGSTQDVASELAEEGWEEGIVVITGEQTKGRGRRSRSFISPPGGIYLSLLLRPDLKPQAVSGIPLLAGVAVTRAIRRATILKPTLKWPNDIILGGRKVGGILAEMKTERGRIQYINLGIGINVSTSPSLLPEEASSLADELGEHISRISLLQHILGELEAQYTEFLTYGFEPIRSRWRKLDRTLGGWVEVGGEEGRAQDIDSEGALILKKPDGTIFRVISGDILLSTI